MVDGRLQMFCIFKYGIVWKNAVRSAAPHSVFLISQQSVS